MTAYTFKEKKELSLRLARVSAVGRYRELLSAKGSRLARLRGSDPPALARTLYYALLGLYRVEEIEAVPPSAPSPSSGAEAPASPPRVRKVDKFAAYPGIRWRELDDPMVRMADSIFTDRVNNYSRLLELDPLVSDPADPEVLSEYVERSIRLELCFSELRSFDARGEFLGRHPFITQRSRREAVLEMLASDPDKYFDERKNIDLNITRYSSYLKRPDLDEARRAKYEGFVERFRAEAQLFKDCFNEFAAAKGLR